MLCRSFIRFLARLATQRVITPPGRRRRRFPSFRCGQRALLMPPQCFALAWQVPILSQTQSGVSADHQNGNFEQLIDDAKVLKFINVYIRQRHERRRHGENPLASPTPPAVVIPSPRPSLYHLPPRVRR
ncbi:hypothetical protein KCP69_12615 [Salmonella enterica subsp. enterica]|nr:hypothetical protein KCP69_12615 [Salmonella enterica subsp. enterica]